MSKDLFSRQADVYARYRPSYPQSLINYVLSFVPGRMAAWDCATGNGQAALLLADHFEQVHASDISAKQIQYAVAHPRIIYTVCAAEESPYPDNSFDLVTIAQAYHWLDFEAFEKEVKRVGKTGTIIAIWCYGLPSAPEQDLNSLIRNFYTNVVGPYWDKERKYIDEELKTVPFPFPELPPKTFTMEVNWTRATFLGYINSWSSVQHYGNEKKVSPLDEFAKDISTLWPAEIQLIFEFPIFLRLGRIEK